MPRRVGAPRRIGVASSSRRLVAVVVFVAVRGRPHADGELIRARRRGLLRSVTDTCVRLWRRVHMDLLRYAGCVCRPSF
ncbi:putative leader peptide [Streptomyces hirsutus]|uniref:putative leader peptide n=1 Tax=Streptomyces hirsutus TaxID=35620 RepID=UPI00389A1581